MGTSKGCEEKRKEVVKEREGVVRETLTKHQAQRANAKTGGLQPGKVYDGRRGRSLLIREPEARPDARPCATHTAAEDREDGAQQTHKQAHNKHTKHERDMMKKRRETKRE